MNKFELLGIKDSILKAINDLGYDEPMPIQETVIPELLTGKQDIIALAQTGTGKTAAFGLPLLQLIDSNKAYPQALVLAPTRELCLQIARDIENFAKYLPEVSVVAVYGGASIEEQIRQIQRGCQVVVATPGRLLDHVRRNTIDLERVEILVLDEADEMLNMGFTEDINSILNEVSSERRLLLFSATLPKEIEGIIRKYMSDPARFQVGNRNEGNANITHNYYMVQAKDKYNALKRVVDFYPAIYGIIFCRTRRDTQEVADKLIVDGYNAESLHGDLSQSQRDAVMQKFRLKSLQLLVATDVAARGLDVNNLTHVIHYSLPDDYESYTHRSGRTARAGKSGISIALCHIKDKGKLKLISKETGITFNRQYLPSGIDICKEQLSNMVDKIINVEVEEAQLAPYIEAISGRLMRMDQEELIKRLMFLEGKRMIDYYDNAPEIYEVEEFESKRDKNRERSATSKGAKEQTTKGFTRLMINLGKKDRLYPNTLIDVVNYCMEGFIEIGKINLGDKRSFFEVRTRDVEQVLDNMNDFDYDGRAIQVKVDMKPEKMSDSRFENGNERDRRRRNSRSEGRGRQERPNRSDKGRGRHRK